MPTMPPTTVASVASDPSADPLPLPVLRSYLTKRRLGALHCSQRKLSGCSSNGVLYRVCVCLFLLGLFGLLLRWVWTTTQRANTHSSTPPQHTQTPKPKGNLHGILVGRENLPDGILYASRESHYSVFKAARMYRMDSVQVATLETGEVDYDELEQKLRENVGRPAILNVNIGTTVKGAVDDLDRILDILKAAGYT